MRTALLLLLLAGCAAPPAPKEPPPLGPGEIRSAHAAENALTIGSTTKADVRAALGEATVIDFPSGYEVWIYRERTEHKRSPPGRELVLLFDPAGILMKSRTAAAL